MTTFLEKYKTQIHQAGVFAITASLYSMLHAARTAWAYSKPTLADEYNYSNTFLSMLDFSFLCSYAVGLFLNGWLGDRLKLKTLLCQGMLATVFALVNFSLIGGFMDVTSLLLGVPLFALLGLGQSSGFPGCMAILANWFPAKHRGLVFGAWMTNINLGNIFGQQLGRVFLDVMHIEWPYLLLLCGGIIFVLVLVVLKFLYVSPSEVGITINGSSQETTEKGKQGSLNEVEVEIEVIEGNIETISTAVDLNKPRAIGFWEAWKKPGVFLYAVVYVCIKATTSALMFWLPTYLKLDIGFKEDTATLLACFELGQLVGVIGLGYVADSLCNKSIAIVCSLFGATAVFLGLNFVDSPDDKVAFIVLLSLAGALIGGPAGLICGAVSSDLGEKKGKGSENSEQVKATSTIIGIIDGSGTVGGAIVQPIIPFVRSSSFILYTVLLLIATVLTPLAQRQATKQHIEKGLAKADQNNPEVEVKEFQGAV